MAFEKAGVPTGVNSVSRPSTRPTPAPVSTTVARDEQARRNYGAVSTKEAEFDIRKLKDDAKAATDIVGLIGEYVALRPHGSQMVGLCPFHSDSNPSFSVNADLQVYRCWSCAAGEDETKIGGGGDALTFVRRHLGYGYSDGVKFLARRAGIPIPGETSVASSRHLRTPVQPPRPERQHTPGEPNLKAEKAPVYDVMNKAFNVYSVALGSSVPAQEYLTKTRGMDLSKLARYGIGFAPEGFNSLRPTFSNYAKDDSLIDAGLVKQAASGHRYDFFRERVVFALRDDSGRVVALGGRRLIDESRQNEKGETVKPPPKYMNSPETAIFNKSEMLFGWYENKQDIIAKRFLLVVEGYMDVIGLACHGVMNTSACMGTALTDQHIAKITATVNDVVFCFDGDTAGQEAAYRSMIAMMPKLDGSIRVRFMTLPEGLDPDEYVSKYGTASFDEQIECATPLNQYWEYALSSHFDASTPKNRDKLYVEAQSILAMLPKGSSEGPQLSQIAARLAGRNQSTVSSQSRSSAGLSRNSNSTFTVNGPSDRLYVAVMRLPGAAAQVRPLLISQQNVATSSDALPGIALWQAKYDQSMAAGHSMHGNIDPTLSTSEQRRYLDLVQAAPSILNQHIKNILDRHLARQHQSGELDDTSYLSKISRSCFAKPN